MAEEIDPKDPEPFIKTKDLALATDKFLNECETIAAQDKVPRGYTDELAGGIGSTLSIKADGSIEAYLTAFAQGEDGENYAITQHEDEHYHLGKPPFRSSFNELGQGESAKIRYWDGFAKALADGSAVKSQTPYLVDAALEALDRGFFEKFFGDLVK